jgi:transcriptional regulator with XRE-family HTH domain
VSDWQERLSEAMEARGISGGELARRTGFTPQYINSMRSKERGGRLPHDTAQRLAQALGITVEWLTAGTGQRERLSDVFPIYTGAEAEPASATERYPSRAEVVALLRKRHPAEVIDALRAAVPKDPGVDPGRQYWLDHARELALELQRIQADPVLSGEAQGTDTMAPPPTEGRPQEGAPRGGLKTSDGQPPSRFRVSKDGPPSTLGRAMGDGLPRGTPRPKKSR